MVEHFSHMFQTIHVRLNHPYQIIGSFREKTLGTPSSKFDKTISNEFCQFLREGAEGGGGLPWACKGPGPSEKKQLVHSNWSTPQMLAVKVQY